MAYVVTIPSISAVVLHALQLDIAQYLSVQKKSKPVILLNTLKPTISFGAQEKNNALTHKGLSQVSLPTRKNSQIQNAKLQLEGIKNCSFIQTRRGGGSTYLGPGQRTMFYIHDVTHYRHEAANRHDALIDEIMVQTYTSILDSANQTIHSHPLKDFYVEYEGLEQKIGSKGISFKQINGNNFSLFGGSFHVNNVGLNGFRYVKPCGLPISVISCQDILGYELSTENFDEEFIQTVSRFESPIIRPDDSRNIFQKNVEAYIKRIEKQYF